MHLQPGQPNGAGAAGRREAEGTLPRAAASRETRTEGPKEGEGVTEKFMCPTHREAKQTETLEFGAEKCLLQGQARRTGGLCSKNQESDGFGEKHLQAKFAAIAAGCVTS